MISMSPVPDDVPSSRSALRVSLPVGNVASVSDDSARAFAPELSTLVRNAQMPRVLVADDDEWIRDVLARVLARNNYHVTSVSSAEEALDLLQRSSFDLLISDIMMQGMSGLDMVPMISALCPQLPIVLITAYGDSEMMRMALRCGASDFITKPFTIETIPLIVERNLERRALEEAKKQAHDETIRWTAVQTLAAAMDAKEPFTAEHSRRVAMLAVAIAEAMHLSCEDQQTLNLAAQVHDVGKIATPDYILTKPGPLNEEEQQMIRRHPEKGAQLIGQVEQLSRVAEAVRYHHERWDGAGYPCGLEGDEIPLLSRIIAVADAFEVMTADRVYRSRMSVEDAYAQLQLHSGTQFDPEVVAAFSTLYPDSLPY